MKKKLIKKLLAIYTKIKNTLVKAARKAIDAFTQTQKTATPYKTVKRKRRLNVKRFSIACTAAVLFIALILTVVFTATGKHDTAAAAAAGQTDIQTLAAGAAAQQTPQPSPEQEDGEKEEEKEKEQEPEEEGLQPGTHDERVPKMQERLMDLDYMDPDEPTDFYGPQTEYAIQLFQRKHGLQVDGIAGEKTLALLYSKEAKHYTVFLGARGTDVEELQKQLIELDYLKGKATGYFGTDTETAVKGFQKRNGLDIDGNVGTDTREALYSEDAKKAAEPETKKPAPKKTVKKEKTTTKKPDEKSVKALIAFAKKQLGKKYVRGGKGPSVFDCSGFVYYCLKNVGVKLRYMTSAGWAQSSWPKVLKMSELKAGDIVCFRGHVGIYLGSGKMIDASSGQGKIRITGDIRKSAYWTRNFRHGRRVLTK